jgi:hypothetical protein
VTDLLGGGRTTAGRAAGDDTRRERGTGQAEHTQLLLVAPDVGQALPLVLAQPGFLLLAARRCLCRCGCRCGRRCGLRCGRDTIVQRVVFGFGFRFEFGVI